MNSRLNILYEKKPCYDIVFSTDFQSLAEELKKLDIENRKACIITDSHVLSLYGDEVMDILGESAGKVFCFLLRQVRRIKPCRR